jgi:hypothetical protein
MLCVLPVVRTVYYKLVRTNECVGMILTSATHHICDAEVGLF